MGRKHRSAQVAFRPAIEPLERRLLLFANPIHKEMTSLALGFIKDDILSDINDEHRFQELAGVLDPDEHFDGCHFSGGAAEINKNYQDALAQAQPDDFDSDDLADQFGQLLHGAQDFYAHSNWIDLGQRTLIDTGTGLWGPLEPYSIHDGVMLVEGEDKMPIVPGHGQAMLNRTDFVATVTFPVTGEEFKGVISGTFGADKCPDNIAVTHGSLNKDDPDDLPVDRIPLHYQARFRATDQTVQEFRRLGALIRERYNTIGVCKLLEEWVKPDARSQARARELLAIPNPPVDMVLVMDATSSMIRRSADLKAAATNIMGKLFQESPCSRVAIVQFDDKDFPTDPIAAFTHQPFSNDISRVSVAIQHLGFNGGRDFPELGGDFSEAVYAGLVYAIENQQDLGQW